MTQQPDITFERSIPGKQNVILIKLTCNMSIINVLNANTTTKLETKKQAFHASSSNNFAEHYSKHAMDLKDSKGLGGKILKLLKITDKVQNTIFKILKIHWMNYSNRKLHLHTLIRSITQIDNREITQIFGMHIR